MIFKKKQKMEAYVPARVVRMSDRDLIDWGGLLVMQLGKAFDQFSYSNGKVNEVEDALTAFHSVWAELLRRNT